MKPIASFVIDWRALADLYVTGGSAHVSLKLWYPAMVHFDHHSPGALPSSSSSYFHLTLRTSTVFLLRSSVLFSLSVWAYLSYAGKNEGRKKLECWNAHMPAIPYPNSYTCRNPRCTHFHYFHCFIIFVKYKNNETISVPFVCLTIQFLCKYAKHVHI